MTMKKKWTRRALLERTTAGTGAALGLGRGRGGPRPAGSRSDVAGAAGAAPRTDSPPSPALAAGRPDFDAVVVGSGFGGAVSACRLAEGGYRVLVLERGRRWSVAEYPRQPEDAWTWNQEDLVRDHGWVEFRFFDHMTVVAG